MAHDHPNPSDSGWDNPDFCPFCGTELSDPGAGFIDHLETSETCRRRFKDWRENVAGDVSGEWMS